MAFATIQPSFAAGELSPSLFARVDLAKYHTGLALSRNFFSDYRGGAPNRSGTQYIDTITSVGQPRAIPFTVATTAAYVLVFLTGYIRVYANGAFVVQIASPYATSDLPLLKYTQSADVLTLTHPSYPVHNLTQTGPSTFTIALDVIGPITLPPTGVSAYSAPNVGSLPTFTFVAYGYQVTAVSADGKEESLGTDPVFVPASELGVGQSTNVVQWTASVSAPSYYKIYKAGPFNSFGADFPSAPPSVYGFIGQSVTTTFTDNNISPDYSQTTPQFQDPFSPGQLSSVTGNGGSGYTGITVPLVFTGGTPTEAATGYALIDQKTLAVVGAVLTFPGRGYLTAPVVTDTGANTATYVATVGQLSGTYPGCVTYFQQRRTFGGTLNFPETFVASSPGYYDNFDTSPISLASDGITVSIASRQDNAIKSMVQMPTGLIIFTTGGGFLVSGGNAQAAITPSDVVAFQQASSGANDVPPLVVNYDVLYVQNRGATVRDLAFNFYVQSYTGTDRSVLASHLFLGYLINEWTYAEEPFRLIHAVRNDGTLLIFTYVPEQEVYAWSHYDTNGLFVSVTSIPEGQQNAVYVIVQRLVGGVQVWFLERFASRIFNFVWDAWFLDAALALSQTMPAANLQLGIGAGVVSSVVTATASAAAFSSGSVGDVIWGSLLGGGQATVTTYVDAEHVTVTINQPFPITPNDPFLNPVPLTSGNWSLDAPVTVVTGLDYLNGLMVSAIADGVPVAAQLVVGGTLTLPQPATKVIAGLAYQCQLQTLKLDTGDPTIQGKRKNIPAVTWRVDKTLGIKTGPDFLHLTAVKVPGFAPYSVPQPLISDDLRTIVQGAWEVNGQICVQQDYPLPCTLLGYIPEVVPGDTGR